MDDYIESVRLRGILDRKKVSWMDVERPDRKRTVFKRGDYYWYADQMPGQNLVLHTLGDAETVCRAMGVLGARERI